MTIAFNSTKTFLWEEYKEGVVENKTRVKDLPTGTQWKQSIVMEQNLSKALIPQTEKAFTTK